MNFYQGTAVKHFQGGNRMANVTSVRALWSLAFSITSSSHFGTSCSPSQPPHLVRLLLSFILQCSKTHSWILFLLSWQISSVLSSGSRVSMGHPPCLVIYSTISLVDKYLHMFFLREYQIRFLDSSFQGKTKLLLLWPPLDVTKVNKKVIAFQKKVHGQWDEC